MTLFFRNELAKAPLLAAVTTAAVLASMPAAAVTPQSILPASDVVSGWTMAGVPQTYNGDTLYNLIDGGADAVKQYSFQSVAHALYKPAGRGSQGITVDVYDMTDLKDAFGLFSQDSFGAKPLQLGAGGSRTSDGTGISFWKNRYLVQIASTSRSPQFLTAMLRFGRTIAGKIPGSNAPLPLFSSLPPGHAPMTEKYVRMNAEARAFLNDAIVARYPSLGPTAELFIASYPSSGGASAAYGKYLTAEKRNRGLVLLHGVGQAAFAVLDTFQKNVVVSQKGTHLVGVVKANSMAAAQNLVRQAVARVH